MDRWIIGVNDKTKETVWQFNSGGYITFNIKWAVNEPSNGAGIEHCVEVLKDKSWNDIPCTTNQVQVRGLICERFQGMSIQFRSNFEMCFK